jgi:hypothetical protein
VTCACVAGNLKLIDQGVIEVHGGTEQEVNAVAEKIVKSERKEIVVNAPLGHSRD